MVRPTVNETRDYHRTARSARVTWQGAFSSMNYDSYFPFFLSSFLTFITFLFHVQVAMIHQFAALFRRAFHRQAFIASRVVTKRPFLQSQELPVVPVMSPFRQNLPP